MRVLKHIGIGTLLVAFCAAGLSAPPPLRAQTCTGDCGGDGHVSGEDLDLAIGMLFGAGSNCSGLDRDNDGVRADDLVAAVISALSTCPPLTPTITTTPGNPTPTPTSLLPTLTPTALPSHTPTQEASQTATHTPTAESSATPTSSATPPATATSTPTATTGGVLSIADAVARDANGVAVHLGQIITTEGVLTVSAGVFANNKLKVFAQDNGAGILVFHPSSAQVAAFQAGQRLRATGLIIQQDPSSPENPTIGTVAVDISAGSATVLSDGNALPNPQPVTVAALNANGNGYTGTLVRIDGVRKTGGSWPTITSRSTQVDISDDDGASTAILRFQKNTISEELVNALTAIGDGAFTLVGIVVQDDATNDGKLLSGYEIWARGVDDIQH